MENLRIPQYVYSQNVQFLYYILTGLLQRMKICLSLIDKRNVEEAGAPGTTHCSSDKPNGNKRQGYLLINKK